MNTEILNPTGKKIANLKFKSDKIVENKRNAKQIAEINYFIKFRKAHYENYKNELHILRYDSGFGPCVATLRGNSKKITNNYRYKSIEDREKRILDFKKSADSWLKLKEDRKEKKKNNRITAEVGDLFYTSWGYDQTNIDFYQVIEKVGKATVIIRKISAAVLENEGSHDRIKAVKNSFIGEPMRKRLGTWGIKIASYATATKTSWESTKSETNSYFAR